MTLIVGAIARDGIVLAADKRAVSFAENETEVDDLGWCRKLFQVEPYNVAYGLAGDETTIKVGRELCDWLTAGIFNFGDIESTLKSIANKTLLDIGIPDRIRRTMLVAFYGDQVRERQLWHLDISYNASLAAREEGIKTTGAFGNRGRFLEHYWKRDYGINELTVIASMIVLAGHKADSSIAGLDVAICDGLGFHWLTEEEVNELHQKWDAVDSAIRSQIRPEGQGLPLCRELR